MFIRKSLSVKKGRFSFPVISLISTIKMTFSSDIKPTIPPQLKISAWNINGLRAIVEKGSIAEYISTSNPDILCLSEIKIDSKTLTQQDLSTWIPKGHSFYFNCCTAKKGYCGTAIISKVPPINVSYGFDDKYAISEGRIITAEYENFYLVTCYVPNSGLSVERYNYRVETWDVLMRNYLKELKEKKPVILCGDLNVAHREIDIYDPKGKEKSAGFTKMERENFGKLLSSGYVDTFRHFYPDQVKYTWWSYKMKSRARNLGWRIDYFLVNQEYLPYVQDSVIRNDILGSDHCPVEILLKLV